MHKDITTELKVTPLFELGQISIEYTEYFKGDKMLYSGTDIYLSDIPLLMKKLQAALKYFEDMNNSLAKIEMREEVLTELVRFSQDIGLYDI